MKDSEENDPDKITLNTLFSQLKKLEEIILDQKDLKDLKDLKEAKEAKDGECMKLKKKEIKNVLIYLLLFLKNYFLIGLE